MAEASEAAALLAKMEREGFPPMDPAEFQRAYALMVKVAAGALPRPVLTETLIDPATGEASEPGSPAEWGMAAAGQMLNDGDPLKPANFSYRATRVFNVALEKDYGKYRGDANGRVMHVALLATIARVAFSTRTTPKALRAAFAAEFKRQRAHLPDTMVEVVELTAKPAPPVVEVQHYAIEPLPGVVSGSYVTLTLAEIRKGYDRMIRVAGGIDEAPPVRGDEIGNVDTGAPVALEDNLMNRGWIAGARALGDPGSPKPTSFAARMLKVLPIVQGPEYAEYRTDVLTIHIALIAAMGSVQFNGRTTEQDLRKAFAAEASRQFGRVDELMAEAMAEPDFQHQAIGSTRH